MKIFFVLLFWTASTFEARAQAPGLAFPSPGRPATGHGYTNGLLSVPIWRQLPRQDPCMECRYLFPGRLDELRLGCPQQRVGRARLRDEFTPGGRRDPKLDPLHRRIGRLGAAVLRYR
jgi:hypothetical protein